MLHGVDVIRPLRLCVFCGSSTGDRPLYLETAKEVGRRIVAAGAGLVYGGGGGGCMGALADAALAAGGEVIGVIPAALAEREVAHRGLTRLHVVDSMHERKALMFAESDGFLALPGGFGTLEEMFEIVTWRQLGIHGKPSAILNAGGYYDALLRFCDEARDAGFVSAHDRSALCAGNDTAGVVSDLLERAQAHKAKTAGSSAATAGTTASASPSTS